MKLSMFIEVNIITDEVYQLFRDYDRVVERLQEIVKENDLYEYIDSEGVRHYGRHNTAEDGITAYRGR